MTELAGGFKCKNGHLLGQVIRNGSGLRVLLLYRNARKEEEPPTNIDSIAMIEGYAADVKCSICGSVRMWVPGADALAQLIEAARKKLESRAAGSQEVLRDRILRGGGDLAAAVRALARDELKPGGAEPHALPTDAAAGADPGAAEDEHVRDRGG